MSARNPYGNLPGWNNGTGAAIADLQAEVAGLRAELAEVQRAKYGTPCKCEGWIEQARHAEERLREIMETLKKVLTEAGLHAHKIHCPNRLVRSAQWDKYGPCAACGAERILAAQPEMTPEQREAQRRSFAYGNAHLSNPNVTREMIDRAAEELDRERAAAQPEESRYRCECGSSDPKHHHCGIMGWDPMRDARCPGCAQPEEKK